MYEQERKIFNMVLKAEREVASLADTMYKQGVDIYEMPLFDSIYEMSKELMQSTFGKNAHHELSWWLYDCKQLDGSEWEDSYYTDADGKPIVLNSEEKFFNHLVTSEEFADPSTLNFEIKKAE